jgi:ribonuclease R
MSRRRSSKKQLHNRNPGRKSRDNRDKKQRSFTAVKPGTKLKARVDKNAKGFAFLIFDGKGEDIFVNPRDASRLFHGDRVEVTLAYGNEIQDIKVIEHRFRELVGRFQFHPDFGGRVIYERRKTRIEVLIPKVDVKISENDWVRVKLRFSGGPHVTGEILDVYGADLPATADIAMVAGEFNLTEKHSADAVREAQNYGNEISAEEASRRKDLKSVPFVTIDGADARDFDDAVYVEKHKSGYVLWVGIADVSFYVRPQTKLDEEAFTRGTSVYFPERAFHMLPTNLSENLCSLKPNVPRLSLVAKMEFDHQGKKKRTDIYEAVILSKRRIIYEELEKEHQDNLKNKDWEYRPHYELYQVLKKSRHDRGSIDFDLPEAKVKVDSNGVPTGVEVRDRLDSHRLIEEFMIAANEAVTEWMIQKHKPFIYRIHEEPTYESLKKFQRLAKNFGFHLNFEGGASPKIFSEFVKKLEGHKGQLLLNMSLLRSMKQAVYSSILNIHFGLASEGYTHFTSPIRRYPDLVVHRLLKQTLKGEKKNHDSETSEIAKVAEHCSFRERIASDAERESIKLKQVRLMTTKLGEEFDGTIIGIGESGLFVQLKDPYVDGFVSKDSLEDLENDTFEFNENRMVMVGQKRKRLFHFGDSMRIRVVRADIERRSIEFEWIRDEKTRQKSPR